ncbi:MAG: BNR repeat-containing protein [Steroidobacter sp.]
MRYCALTALLIFAAARSALAVEAVPPAQLLSIGPAYAGSSVNVVANRRHSLFTHGRMQFAAYYDADHFMVLAQRSLDGGPWTTRRSQFKGSVEDAHNSISIAVDGAGFVHVSWDHHTNPLNYARSVRPLDLELAPVARMTGIAERQVTYPEFHLLPNGDLLFLYRDGQSGNGRLVLNRYSVNGRVWRTVQPNLIDGKGARSPYWNLAVDRAGGVHLAWTWRETPDVATNHDFAYAFSADGGVTWQTIDGGALKIPLTIASDGYAARIPTRHNLMNPPWIAADARGRPYIVSYWSDSPDSPPQFRVVYHREGDWRTETITQRTEKFVLAGGGTKRPPVSRGVLILEGENAAHLVYRDDLLGAAILMSTKQIGSGEWQERKLTSGPLGAWEPTLDPVQWQQFQQIHLFLQPVQQRDGDDAAGAETPASDVAVLVVDPK